ncbi:MAG: efflux RND transporter periplasmic adaptor subunit [Rhodoferax sp.]|nr:efflux RND transporter periplasmic adaptor subunit [Rhodoferax sp.]
MSESATPIIAAALDARSLIGQLQQLRNSPTAELDWNRYCDLIRQLCKASHAAVVQLLAQADSLALLGRASDSATWSPLQTMPPGLDLFAKATEQGYTQAPAQDPQGQTWLVLVLALQGLTDYFLILNIKPQERSQLNELTLRALLCVDFKPLSSGTLALTPEANLGAMLGLAAEVMQQPNFSAAGLALVNGLAVAWELLHVSLGWVDGARTEVVAISHLDRFERATSQTQRIEAALLPAVIQGSEVWWPTPTDTSTGLPAQSLTDTQALADFAHHLGVSQVVAVPMRDAHGHTQAVLLLAPGSRTIPDLNELLLALELVQPRLSDLRHQSLGLRQRGRAGLQALSERLFGPEQPLLKLGMVVLVLLLLYVTFGTWHYRLDASAQLNTDSTRLISAQFDGRIDQVYASAGDLVKAGDLLVALDTRDLLQQQSELTAEVSKGQTEVNKFRAEGLLAETEIAQARLEQSLAKAQRVQSYLEQAQSKAPFEGVIVEGEKKDLLGAPVKKGDRIFRLAKVEGLYITLMVSERDMRHLAPQASGEVALLSHPDVNIAMRISSVIPVAQVKGQDGNQFMVKAELLQAPQAWWRPGMTGLARIDVGDKNIAWILTHRLVERLRLMLWW